MIEEDEDQKNKKNVGLFIFSSEGDGAERRRTDKISAYMDAAGFSCVYVRRQRVIVFVCLYAF